MKWKYFSTVLLNGQYNIGTLTVVLINVTIGYKLTNMMHEVRTTLTSIIYITEPVFLDFLSLSADILWFLNHVYGCMLNVCLYSMIFA